jgi:tetratricopeptide (TPR) repeat protein
MILETTGFGSSGGIWPSAGVSRAQLAKRAHVWYSLATMSKHSPKTQPLTLDDLYLACAALLVPDTPIPHLLLVAAVKQLHGQGNGLTISTFDHARDRLIARQLLQPGRGKDRSMVIVERKTARAVAGGGAFDSLAQEALETGLLWMLSHARAPGELAPAFDPQIDRVLGWSVPRADAATATLCTYAAAEMLARSEFARAADLLRRALVVDPDPDDAAGRRQPLIEALLRLGQPHEAIAILEQLAAPQATMPAARDWASRIDAAQTAPITPLPWSCVPNDLVPMLGGPPAFQEAYLRSMRLIGGEIFGVETDLVSGRTPEQTAMVLPLDPTDTLLARQRAAQAADRQLAGDITTSWGVWIAPSPRLPSFAGLTIVCEAPVRGQVDCLFRLDDPNSHSLLRHIDATGRLGVLVAPPGTVDPFQGSRLLQHLILDVAQMPDGLRERLRRPPASQALPQAKVPRGRNSPGGGGGTTPAA